MSELKPTFKESPLPPSQRKEKDKKLKKEGLNEKEPQYLKKAKEIHPKGEKILNIIKKYNRLKENPKLSKKIEIISAVKKNDLRYRDISSFLGEYKKIPIETLEDFTKTVYTEEAKKGGKLKEILSKNQNKENEIKKENKVKELFGNELIKIKKFNKTREFWESLSKEKKGEINEKEIKRIDQIIKDYKKAQEEIKKIVTETLLSEIKDPLVQTYEITRQFDSLIRSTQDETLKRVLIESWNQTLKKIKK